VHVAEALAPVREDVRRIDEGSERKRESQNDASEELQRRIETHVAEALAPVREDLRKLDEGGKRETQGDLKEDLQRRIEAEVTEALAPLQENLLRRIDEAIVVQQRTAPRESHEDPAKPTNATESLRSELLARIEADTRSAIERQLRESITQLRSELVSELRAELQGSIDNAIRQVEVIQTRLSATELGASATSAPRELSESEVAELLKPVRGELDQRLSSESLLEAMKPHFAEDIGRAVSAEVERALSPRHPLIRAGSALLHVLGSGFLVMLVLCAVATLPVSSSGDRVVTKGQAK